MTPKFMLFGQNNFETASHDYKTTGNRFCLAFSEKNSEEILPRGSGMQIDLPSHRGELGCTIIIRFVQSCSVFLFSEQDDVISQLHPA